MKIKITPKKQLTIFAVTASVSLLSVGIGKLVQASSAQMLKRVGSNFCLNANRPGQGSTVNLWGCDSNDPDQKWEKVPVTTGTTTKLMIKRVGSDFCLNANRPGQSSKVNLWKCDANDPDQKWEDIGNQMLRRAGSNFCLNAYRPAQSSTVNLWGCDSKDGDQKWENLAPSSNSQKFTMQEYYQRLYGHTQAGSERGFIPSHKAIDSASSKSPYDVRALVGGEVRTVKNGTVVNNPYYNNKCQNNSASYNGTVEIWNPDLQRTFTYLHFATNSIRVKKGDKVNPGDIIGTEGTTGCSTGRHTHVAVNLGAEDPLVTLGTARSRGILDKKYK